MSTTVPMYGFGGGGTPLNFKVVGGASAPSNPKENTIWINTSTAISEWAFSQTQPNSPPAGMVWFRTGASSPAEFDALKKNIIVVYPLFAKQYVSGSWVDRTAKSYLSGQWVDWTRWLYNNGNLFESFTGGLGTTFLKWSSSVGGTGNATITYNADSVVIAQNGASKGCAVHFANKIDLSEFSTLHFDGILQDAGSDEPQRCALCIWSDFGTYKETNRVAYLLADRADSEKTLDVSGLNGSYYIGFYMFTHNLNNKASSVTMRRMWLE